MDDAPDTISNIEPNPVGLALARALRAGKGGLNALGTLPKSVPLVGGQGAGDLIFGKGPEAAESWAHGFPPTTGTGMTFGLKPEAVDLALTPAPIGLGKMAGQKLLAKMLRKEAEAGATDVGRREFLKQGAALAGAGAVATAIPDVAKLAAKGLGKEAAAATGAQTAKALGANLSEHLLNGLKLWEKSPQATKWLDDLNTGVSSGTNEGTVAAFRKSLEGEFPHEEFKKFVGDVPLEKVDPDLVGKLYRNETHHAKHFDQDIFSKGFEKFYDEYKASPKLQALHDEYMITGKLPKGAPDELKYIKPSDTASPNMGALVQRIYSHVLEDEM